MPVLKNARRERFAQGIASGKTITDAHEQAGYERHDGNASKLAADKEIIGRVQEIIGKAAERAGVTVERILAELAKIGFSNMADYVTVGRDGLPFVDWSAITPDQMAAIREVTVETRMEMEVGEDGKKEATPVRKVKFGLIDKRAALVDMGKHLGMFVDKVEHSGSIDMSLGDRLQDSLMRTEVKPIAEPTQH